MKETLPEKPKKSPWRFVCLIGAGIAFLLMMWDLFIDTLISGILTGANESVGIIGGADGPTAIFVTSAPPSFSYYMRIISLVILVVAGIAGFYHYSHRPGKQ